jgi:hypothetical protein
MAADGKGERGRQWDLVRGSRKKGVSTGVVVVLTMITLSKIERL